MCGILGYVGPGADEHAAVVGSLPLIAHRGPDSQGVERSGAVSLGMTRLAIIDLPGGSQPMLSPDEGLCVVFNGEIYNYREIREVLRRRGHRFVTMSDTEVLLHAYEEYGDDLCAHLRGMFAFAIHDRGRERVLLARDRFGKKPLYFRKLGESFWFGSELKVVVAASRRSAPLALSQQAIYDYLSFGCVPQPETIYHDVESLPAGSIAVLERSEVTVTQYWAPELSPRGDLSVERATLEARRLISEAVKLRLRSDVPLGVFLSGGLDSSIVALEAAAHVGADLRTFTVSMDDRTLDESAVARRTAAQLGVRHEVLPLSLDVREAVLAVVDQYDQPFADSSAIPSMGVARLAREHVKVVLNGDGGDELFGGYRRHIASHQLDRVRPLLRGLAPAAGILQDWHPRRRSRAGLAMRLLRGANAEFGTRYLTFTQDLLRESDRGAIWRGDSQVQPSERLLVADAGDSFMAAQMMSDITVNLASALLVKMDIACMASSVEARSPFMDSEVAQFAFSLPPKFKVRGNSGKWLLRHAYKDDLPREVIAGSKKGFEVPLSQWMRGPLQALTADSVLAPDARVLEYLDSDIVVSIFSGSAYQDRNTANLRYAILMLELWLRGTAP